MEKRREGQNIIIAILAVAVLTMSIGFAAFFSQLDIGGEVTVAKSIWNIAFDENTYQESASSVTAQKTINGTSMSYAVTLDKPGDFYEFTINVKNVGTFDANLTGITLSTLTTEQQKYLSYKLTYDTTTYTATTNNLSIPLAKNTGEKPVKVRVEYIQPTSPDDLPQTEVNLTLTASLTYNQA